MFMFAKFVIFFEKKVLREKFQSNVESTSTKETNRCVFPKKIK